MGTTQSLLKDLIFMIMYVHNIPSLQEQPLKIKKENYKTKGKVVKLL